MTESDQGMPEDFGSGSDEGASSAASKPRWDPTATQFVPPPQPFPAYQQSTPPPSYPPHAQGPGYGQPGSYQQPPPGFAQPGAPGWQGHPYPYDPEAKSKMVSFFTCGIGGVWGLVDGILILTGSEQFRTDATGRPLVE